LANPHHVHSFDGIAESTADFAVVYDLGKITRGLVEPIAFSIDRIPNRPITQLCTGWAIEDRGTG
jgi:hypothetical protein